MRVFTFITVHLINELSVIEGNNDGQIDIWQSEVDALTTAANYLNQLLWQQTERWGREALMPENLIF
jgi:membrane-bound lytic murein transglycosylase B